MIDEDNERFILYISPYGIGRLLPDGNAKSEELIHSHYDLRLTNVKVNERILIKLPSELGTRNSIFTSSAP